eukprot:TRINITY_DN142_c0_g1_i11.p2 TRINITY_DN142_c0_g1~~TRINITY_DN142_c0_g1_i11.p2  ORF type:complete len:253 (-),score=26.97 TRINITY_DN142_c0_g1_i11:1290-2048(-)
MFKHTSTFLLMLDKMNPPDGKHPKYLTTTSAYLKFTLTYKWSHVHKLYTCCGLSEHLTSAYPLHNIFITEDIWAIFHTDLNPAVPCRDKTFDGGICISETPSVLISLFPDNDDETSQDIPMESTLTYYQLQLSSPSTTKKHYVSSPLFHEQTIFIKYDIFPTTFSSTVDHLKIAFAFMPYSSFKSFTLKYIQKFNFVKHRPDISRVAVPIYRKAFPQVKTDINTGFDSSYFTESLLMNRCNQPHHPSGTSIS